MKKYPKMKPSGVEWIGDVPKHWELGRIKNLLLSETNGIWGEEMQGDENDIVCLRVADFDRNFDNISKTGNTYRNIAEKDFDKRSLVLGDLLIEKSGGGELLPIGRVGLFEWKDEKAVCSNFMARLRPNKEKIRSKFLFYVFKTFYIKRLNVRHIKQTTGIQNLDTASYFNEVSPVPTPPEQTAIAHYLDRKTAQIDQAISEKEGLIDLFREERQAIINHAVTKGIRAGVKMKPSGVEWIGNVPEHWSMKRVKRVCKLQGRIGFKGYSKTDLVNEGEGVLTLGAKHINKKNELDLSSPEFLSWEKYYESPEIMVRQGHVIVTQRGSLGKVVVIDKEIGAATINPSMILLKDLSIDQHFFYYSFNGHFFTSWIEMVNNATAVPMISQEMLANLPIICPDLAEQKEIVSYLNEKTAQIDTAISGIQQEIALLQEYRQALIFEAVTGKIDIQEHT